MLSAEILNRYNKFRNRTDKSVICHAPFVNLNFEQNGNITACCYNRKEVLGRYPASGIMDAWTGSRAEALRENIRSGDLKGGCATCGELLSAGNFSGTKALYYDEYAAPLNPLEQLKKMAGKSGLKMPKVFELELSNTCNLECEMCNGYFSSTIRKNREQLPELPEVYDHNFVKQLAEFMPGLSDIKFLGGEPFLINLYYDIWQEIIRVNPEIKVHITTNGTVLNQKAKSILEKLKVGIVLSIDSLNPETYAKIRSGANFERVMDNLAYFRKLTETAKTYLTIAACPMVNNWKDLPQLLSYSNENGIHLHFNVVWSPEELSLKSLSSDELAEVILFLEKEISVLTCNGYPAKGNMASFNDLLSTLKYWKAENENKSAASSEIQRNAMQWLNTAMPEDVKSESDIFRQILSGILHFEYKRDQHFESATSFGKSPGEFQNLKLWLVFLLRQAEIRSFNRDFLRVLNYLHEKLYRTHPDEFKEKIGLIFSILDSSEKQNQLAYELTETSPLAQIEFIRNSDMELIRQTITARYG